MKKYILILFIVLFSIVPSIVPKITFAAETPTVELDYSGLVKCDGVLAPKGTEPERDKLCDFNALISTVKSGINWLFMIAVPLATALLAYGGILLLTGTQKNIGTAKSIFQSIAKGFIIMLIAWVSVITVLDWFIRDTNKAIINTFVNTPQ